MRAYLKNAQECADNAYKPFAGNAKPEREKFVDAADLLMEAEQSIQSFRELLFSDLPLLPDELLENCDHIDIHIDTVVEQIERNLLPSLKWNETGNFSELQTALQEINKLFPSETPSKDHDKHS